ncbi:hypothetical protein DFH07DRAFT_733046, partial [Mycena maculata]
AFLPIIGTEQCERHVGEALDGGFLYAAATPLSLFGSLGIVKAGGAILCASVSARAARLLADAGFNVEGSVAAMIGVSRPRLAPRRGAFGLAGRETTAATGDQEEEGVEYLADKKFLELLEEQHVQISRVKMELVFNDPDWNRRLCICTLSLACLSITPYIRIIMQEMHDHEPPPPTWTYPLLRIIGSVVSVVVAQFIIQLRIAQILKSALDTPSDAQR